ncbi:hypothetical protein ASO20_02315 [Mycoplasma sp. (ex Biomphalaria glabrata)]|uniref:GNAT family N-acetyltransferase n=1 Tax=Mycoplasma sp. (ex Biomphalaria glabrata) TaxID=1749074 RepID=UPI00073AAE05|nr:GNAT family N-acetyltransferase [Mycoplasma sp. (ex Biomphalaria glabrata)]ALV23471.1 hypothetical protein ASO20_02315 [Mycoplasma sp. (ex Biomphalaria glabrata)]
MRISLAKEIDFENIKASWKIAFKNDSPIDYIDWFFEKNYNPSCTFVLKNKKQLISSLQWKECELQFNDKKQKAAMIFGINTLEEFQNLGYMKKILEHAIKLLSKKYDQILIQAYNWDLYRKFGFVNIAYKYHFSIDWNELIGQKINFIKNPSNQSLCAIYQQFINKFSFYSHRHENDFQLIKEENKFFEVDFYASNNAYVVYCKTNNTIFETCYKTTNDLEDLLISIKENIPINTIVLPLYQDKVNWAKYEKEELFLQILSSPKVQIEKAKLTNINFLDWV